MAADPRPAGEPKELAGYMITGVLGEGGSGTVYAGRAGDREVAIKVLRADQAPTGKERRRWFEEAALLAEVRHSGVVRVFGVGELDDGRPYLAMERLRGESLAERIGHGPLPVGQALQLFDQLAGAVQEIHDRGLIHRDLKPENLMLVDGGQRVVVLDFGIARRADAPPSTTTQAGYQRGTPAVMAPERFFGERATVASDIYELGVVLFVMLTGGLPWREILDARARLNPLTPSKAGATVPPGVEAALMKALSSDPDERPASVGELAAALRAEGWAGPTLPAGTPRLERPPGDAGETDPVRGTPWARAAILLGVVIMVGGLAVALLAGGGGGDRAAAAGDAGAVATTRAAAPTVQAIAGPPDAGPPDAAAVAKVRLPSPRKQAPPPRKPAPAAPQPAKAKAKTKPKAMPWCRKQAALYCTAEFKATEGGMAGELCKRFRAEVARWEALPAEARASLEASCEKNYPTFAAAVAERLRQFREHGGPPAKPSP